MPKIERRRTKVTLYPGNYEAELADLLERAMAAQREEESSGTRRAGTKSKAVALAKDYDEKRAEAVSAGVEVTLWAISYLDWGPLADEHPPRDGNADDAKQGVNMDTFPAALLRASLVTPDTTNSLEELKAAGEIALRELGAISRVHYVKLETAAWNVNVGDDSIPKFSLVSLLKAQRDLDSKRPSESE